MIDSAAGILLLILVSVVLANQRDGTLNAWFKAKFLGHGDLPDRPPSSSSSAASAAEIGRLADLAGGDLVTVNGAQLSRGFAAVWRPVVEAARAAGYNLSGGGWRSRKRQEELRVINGCPDVYTSPASSCRVPTAIPGTSKHETGDAIDVTIDGRTLRYSDGAYKWLVANATRFGIANTVSGEPWHWEAA